MLVKSPLKKKKSKKNRRRNGSKRPKNKQNNSRKPAQKNHGRRIKKRKKRFAFPRVAPWKVILGAIIIGVLGMVYLNHVFATQKLLNKVQQMQQKYNRARRSHDNYRLIYEGMIGPAEIYSKAKSQGFINGGPADKVIKVEKE